MFTSLYQKDSASQIFSIERNQQQDIKKYLEKHQNLAYFTERFSSTTILKTKKC